MKCTANAKQIHVHWVAGLYTEILPGGGGGGGGGGGRELGYGKKRGGGAESLT